MENARFFCDYPVYRETLMQLFRTTSRITLSNNNHLHFALTLTNISLSSLLQYFRVHLHSRVNMTHKIVLSIQVLLLSISELTLNVYTCPRYADTTRSKFQSIRVEWWEWASKIFRRSKLKSYVILTLIFIAQSGKINQRDSCETAYQSLKYTSQKIHPL